MRLTDEERRSWEDNGYIVRRQLLPQIRSRSANNPAAMLGHSPALFSAFRQLRHIA